LVDAVVQGGSLDINPDHEDSSAPLPFLMVDHVTNIDGNKITGVKKCQHRRTVFCRNIFRNHPIMPGVLQLEAIAQVAGILNAAPGGGITARSLTSWRLKRQMAQAGAAGRYAGPSMWS